jgi:serine/threonine-protein kinase RsbW
VAAEAEIAPMDGSIYSITLPSEPRMLSVARSFVEAVCQASNLDRATTHALVIVTGEAITNIVRHAHQNRTDAQMELHVHILADTVELTLEDEGAPFDLDSVPQLPPGEMRIGGRGVYLMRTLMDELSCLPRAEGRCGNVMRMTKRRCAETAMRDVG